MTQDNTQNIPQTGINKDECSFLVVDPKIEPSYLKRAQQLEEAAFDVDRPIYQVGNPPDAIMFLKHGESILGKIDMRYTNEYCSKPQYENGRWSMPETAEKHEIKSATLSGISILPYYQGQGLGAHMLQKALKTLKNNGFAYCSLWADPNGKYLNLYKKQGFQTAVNHKNKMNNVLMARALQLSKLQWRNMHPGSPQAMLASISNAIENVQTQE